MSSTGTGPRRGLIRAALVAAAALLIAGMVVAVVGYTGTSSAQGVVRAYFAALRRGDAPAALGFGDVPAGRTSLLTSTVLRIQQRVAGISDVTVGSPQGVGPGESVPVSYVLDFSGVRINVSDAVSVVHRHGSWHLAAVAVPTRLVLAGAGNRATVDGAVVPTDPVLMFPGAVPIQFDTGTIELDPASAVVHADHPGDLQIAVLPTSSGRAAAQRAVAAAFTACLRGAPTADPRCPLPLGRAVPDSMTGTGPADIAGLLSVSVSTDPDGLFVVTGSITVFGRYQNLDFSNIVHTVTGRFPVSVNALAYTHPPVTVVWQEASS